MGYLEVHPHQNELQGWIGIVSHRGLETAHEGVGDFTEAVAAAKLHNVKLRIGLHAQQQMEQAACGPVEWPVGLACGMHP